MDLSKMESAVMGALGLGPSDGDSNRRLAFLNHVWRYDIPDRIGGALCEGYVDAAVTAGVETIDLYAEGMKSVESPVILVSTGDLMKVYTYAGDFWADYDLSDVSRRQPEAVFLNGMIATVRPIPDASYTIRFYGKVYRDALTSSGISDEAQALAVVAGAAALLASDLGMDSTSQRQQAIYTALVDGLMRRAGGRINVTESRRRDF